MARQAVGKGDWIGHQTMQTHLSIIIPAVAGGDKINPGESPPEVPAGQPQEVPPGQVTPD